LGLPAIGDPIVEDLPGAWRAPPIVARSALDLVLRRLQSVEHHFRVFVQESWMIASIAWRCAG
jgi:hypothetical protein